MQVTHLIQTNGHCVAHNLDFDIVVEEPTEQAAKDKLIIAVREYVEFGLSKGWEEYIYFPAPEKYWAELKNPDTKLEIGHPIEIASDVKPVVLARPHEHQRAAS